MRKVHRWVSLGLALLTLGIRFAAGQSIQEKQFLDAKATDVDPRLKISLTFDAYRMYLGEVLEKVSAQTGVSLSPFRRQITVQEFPLIATCKTSL